MLSTARGKERMPEPQGIEGAGALKERLTGRWSVWKPQAGRMEERQERKVPKKASFRSTRSRRAPELADLE
jgi:hypothetical protein